MLTSILATTLLTQNWMYPPTKTSDQKDTYHGITVADPYRWLEQPITTPEVKAWADAETQLTNHYFDQIPNRKPLLNELLRRVNYERFDVPVQKGKRTFYGYNSGLLPQNVIYVVDQPGATPRILLDPNKLSADGTVALTGTDFSNDGSRMLYGVAKSGSDWLEWNVLDVASGKTIGDPVKWSKFGVGTMNSDGTGFYYLRFPEPKEATAFTDANKNAKIYFHSVGTPQSQDQLIIEDPANPERFFSPTYDDGKTELFIYAEDTGSTNNFLWHVTHNGTTVKINKILNENDANYSPLAIRNNELFLQTNKNAPTGKIVKMPISGGTMTDVVPTRAESIEGSSLTKSKVIVQYMKDAHAQVETFDLAGKPTGNVPLAGLGAVSGFSGDPDSDETYYSYADFTTPTLIYNYDAKTNQSTIYKKPELPLDPSKYVAKQVFVTSNDGTKVPMYIVHRKDLILTGQNPTLMYAYGGFGLSQTPWFSTSRTVWMDMGGIWCLANIRGGSEYGKEWHEAATKVRRQNAYDDFIACGEYLVKEGYTTNKHLAIQGGSNGGLLIGVTMTQRPDLCGVAIPEVGVMDMLRFNKFTIGAAWEGDYGSPENQDEFFSLYRISPYHNLRPGTNYPATLVTTADTDDRVVPAHSFKFAARLQAVQAGPAPCLIRIESSAGHGGGKPIQKALEEVADIYSFTLHNMDIDLPAKF
ncbi:MAG: prolyl oligopeptidase family serine peptidase [Fimbriimonadaceae bacterium]